MRHLAETSHGDQPVHRANHVFRIDDEDRRSVFHQRRRGNVPDFAELRVELLHHELALADEPVDDQAVSLALVAEHDHRELGARGERCRHFQDLVRGDQPDSPAVEIEMLPPFELGDLLVRQLERRGRWS